MLKINNFIVDLDFIKHIMNKKKTTVLEYLYLIKLKTGIYKNELIKEG